MRRVVLILLFSCASSFLLAQENIIKTIAGNGIAAYRGDGGPATNASFVYPQCICLDGFGNLYIVDVLGNTVRKIVLSTGIITAIAGNGTIGFSGDDGPATDALLSADQGICADTAGNIYFGDGDVVHPRIRKITVSTGIINTIAGNGIAGNSGDGGPATNAEFEYPAGYLFDKNGNLYVADLGNNNIRKITVSGIITTIAGNGIAGYSGDGGPAINAELNSPSEIGMDSYGNIIIVDSYNNRLRKIDATTNIISTICGNGTPGYSGNGGPAIDATLDNPYGIFIDKNDNVFFSDGYYTVIREIVAETRIISTVAGCGIAGFSGDGGPAIDAKIQPADVCLDTFGNMYIADFLNYRIREVYNPDLGVKPISPKGELYIYPNPVRDELTIENASGCEMKIYNVLGEEVYEKVISSDKEAVNISGLPNGVYVVQMVDPATMNMVTKKVVKG